MLEPHALVTDPIVLAALREDLGHGVDVTTDAIVPSDARTSADVVARTGGVVAGLRASLRAFTLLGGDDLAIDVRVRDGDAVDPGVTLASIEGSARTILTGERTMLNLCGRLCGIATATRTMVDAVRGTRATIVDTRKTTPGLRALEKYAVRCGGGGNHRFGLDDAVLIKDNHLAVAGSIHEAVARARAHAGHMVKIEVEVDTLEQLGEALAEPIDAVLLDNMSLEMLRDAVALVNHRVVTEASGGVRLQTVRDIAQTGVDLISVGWLTHGAPSLDIALDIAL